MGVARSGSADCFLYLGFVWFWGSWFGVGCALFLLYWIACPFLCRVVGVFALLGIVSVWSDWFDDLLVWLVTLGPLIKAAWQSVL